MAHLVVLVVGTSWAFGGQAPAVRTAVELWGAVGIALFLIAWRDREANRPVEGLTPLRDLWPLLIFDGVIALSCANPTLQSISRDGEAFYVLTNPRWAHFPTCARPDLALHALLLWNGIILSCYSGAQIVSRRSGLRRLLAVVVANGVALAVLGSLQQLVGSDGLWFGLVHSPQDYFFSTFVYHNHWAAFTLLNFAAALGLIFASARRPGGDRRHSPVMAGLVAALLLVASVPLSGSRSGMLLASVFLAGAGLIVFARLIRRRRATGAPVAGLALGMVAVGAVALAAIGYVAGDVIRKRAALTLEQVAEARSSSQLDSRLTLYRDTWRMASDRPLFGWGLDSYGDVFRIYNSQRSVEGWTPYYREAHCDWLQFLAETGSVGTALLVLTGLVPLMRTPGRNGVSAVPAFLLCGCGLILIYATFEFPLANPSVVIGFWLSLFVARRYMMLDRSARIA
ncbi:MAG TPA: O-antigen ligase family protein [Candidatus Didemnitutus sp.]